MNSRLNKPAAWGKHKPATHGTDQTDSLISYEFRMLRHHTPRTRTRARRVACGAGP